jgi:hypothetical protein
METEPIYRGLLDQPSGMEIEPINRGLLDQPLAQYRSTMNSPATNIPCAVSAMSPFTEYMKKLKLEATSEDDIHAGDKTLDAIFAEDLTLGVGGGTALAGRAAATPKEGGDLAVAQAVAALSFVHDANEKEMIAQLKIDEATNPPPVCSEFGQGGVHPHVANQKPPAKEGKHAPLKKTPCQSIIGCDNTGIFLKKAPIVTKKERKKTLYKNADDLPKVSLIVAFFLNTHCHHSKTLPELRPF